MSLVSEEFLSDFRLPKAIQQLVEVLSEHQRKIDGVKAPSSTRKIPYEELLQAFSTIRGSKLYFPYLGSGIGKGPLVELLDGSVKYDMISGIGVHFFGHSHPKLTAIAIAASLSDILIEGNLQQNADSVELVQLLTKVSGLPHCFLTSSGVMANENAIKIAFQKNFPASRVLAFDQCFAGRSLTFSQVTDKPVFRQGLPLNIAVDYIPYFDPENPEESTQLAVHTLKKLLSRYPRAHALMLFELIQGEGGVYSGSHSFFKALMAVLKEHHIAILVDEIQTFGRTTELFAYQHFGLQDDVDIATIGKLSHCCATLFTEEYRPKPGLLSQTFTSSTACIRACKWIIEALLQGNFYGQNGRVKEVEQRFHSQLQSLSDQFPHIIRGPFGVGGMVAFTPYDGEQGKVAAFVQKLFDAGVITFVAGSQPTRVRMLAPIGVITNDEIDDVMSIIKKVLTESSLCM
ncbi:MAG: aminotransferase class III-fold pyridoxal phosphate-dependent enzyme [Parachlamydiaceae bacterium]